MALVITMILVPILMGLGASFVDPIIRSYRAVDSYQKDILANNIAENMFEIAMEETRDLGVGENAEGTFSEDYNGLHAEGHWWVFGSPELDDEYTFELTPDRWYTIPAAGSGNAGGDYCSTNDPAVTMEEINTKLLDLGVNTDPANPVITLGDDPFEWPCHWNKLYEGQTVSIPLYVDGINGVQNPAELELNEFELRVRTACNPSVASGEEEIYKGEICNSEGVERYVLDGDAIDGDSVIIILWEIVAEEVSSTGIPTGRSIVLSPKPGTLAHNSNIRVFNINGYNKAPWNLINLNANSETIDSINPQACSNDNHKIITHLQNNMMSCGPRQFINKPTLNFTLIHTLVDIDTDRIPYLEYQFRTPVVDPNPSIASNEKLIRTEVMLNGGYSETIEKSIDLTKPVTGFVIQQ